jgi:hypothetical protein
MSTGEFIEPFSSEPQPISDFERQITAGLYTQIVEGALSNFKPFERSSMTEDGAVEHYVSFESAVVPYERFGIIVMKVEIPDQGDGLMISLSKLGGDEEGGITEYTLHPSDDTVLREEIFQAEREMEDKLVEDELGRPWDDPDDEEALEIAVRQKESNPEATEQAQQLGLGEQPLSFAEAQWLATIVGAGRPEPHQYLGYTILR